MLKNRQSSKPQVNLKRPAPSNQFAQPEATSTKSEHTLPHRSGTFPVHATTQPSSKPPGRRQKSLDSTQAFTNRVAANGSQSAWMAATPELLTETMTTPEPTSSTSQPLSFASQESSSLAWSQQFNNPNNLPDLMPIMFPSDDPFAYPAQPMSTLEDDHFRNDQSGIQPSRFPYETPTTGVAPSTPSDPSGPGASTPGFEGFSNFPNFAVGAPSSGIKPSLPTRMHANAQSMASSRLHSPISQPYTPSEALSSPDLVSIPNQNFVWQSYNYQPTNLATDQTMQQDPPIYNGPQDVNMSLDQASMGMNTDLGISFDDLFGNNAVSRSDAPNDDWTQWMNPGV